MISLHVLAEFQFETTSRGRVHGIEVYTKVDAQ